MTDDRLPSNASRALRRKDIRQARERARAAGAKAAQDAGMLQRSDALRKPGGAGETAPQKAQRRSESPRQGREEAQGLSGPSLSQAGSEKTDQILKKTDRSLTSDAQEREKQDQGLVLLAGDCRADAAPARGGETGEGALEEVPRRRARREQGAQRRGKSRTKVNYSRGAKGRRSQDRQPAWWSVPVLCVALCALAAVGVFGGGALSRWREFQVARAQVESGTFYPGITVDGVEVSAMTLDQALAAWEEKARQSYQDCQVELEIDGETWLLTPEEMGYTSDYRQVLTSAYAQGRYGTFAQRRDQVEKLAGAWKRDYTTHTGYDEEALLERLSQIATQVSQPAVEATISGFSETGGFTFTEGEAGLVADPHDLLDAVEQAIAQGGGSVSVSRKAVSPGRSVEDLQSLFGQISQAKTNARSSSQNRLTNLKLACEALNGLCIQPGETFSYNGTLGKRTAAKGYKSAPALSSGSHTMQIGGGICQVSTTLFNAVAKAGLKIVERHPHSIPSSYVARGLDATVNWPNQDFKFKNTSDYPIYLSAKVNAQKQVVVAVYGRLLEDGVTIKLKGVTTNTYSPGEAQVVYTDKLPTGQKKWVSDRRTGYKVTTYRIYYKNGKETDREVLFKSTYAASAGKVQIGL